jgi:uncharacterized membrane protein
MAYLPIKVLPTKESIIEGLLLNARMVNAIFDDDNPYTRDIWKYPDTTEWNPDRNTNEFISMLPDYQNGYQLIPVNWAINTDRKKNYFNYLAAITSD